MVRGSTFTADQKPRMLIISMASFFIAVALLMGLLFLPGAWDAAIRVRETMRERVRHAFRWRIDLPKDMRAATMTRLLLGMSHIRQTVVRHRWAVVAATVLVVAPPVANLVLRRTVTLDGYHEAAVETDNTRLMSLLRGERLAPPFPLPQDIFIAADSDASGMVSPFNLVPEKMASADRRWALIDADMQQRVLAVFGAMRERGYEMALVEGYRSEARQAELFRSGYATRAEPGKSCHQHGLAVDAAILRDGRLQWDMSDAWIRDGYFLYGELAEQAGLAWGGRWQGLKDYVHVESAATCLAKRRQT